MGRGGLGEASGHRFCPRDWNCRIWRARWRCHQGGQASLATALWGHRAGKSCERGAGAAWPRVSYSTGFQHQGVAGAGHRLGIGAVTATTTQPPLSTCTVNTHGASQGSVPPSSLTGLRATYTHSSCLSPVTYKPGTWKTLLITKAMQAVSSTVATRRDTPLPPAAPRATQGACPGLAETDLHRLTGQPAG